MCGISGWQIDCSLNDAFRNDSNKLISSLRHRGPDAEGDYHDLNSGVFLGHNRLSIIDLSELGNQPMIDGDGNVLVVNGEIYNYRSLRKQLVSKGHKFNSQSDSEVLLKSFQEWGIRCTEKIAGMYAFAIWNDGNQTLHLARDPMGIKPLYYWLIPGNKGIVFASELKAFIGLSQFSPQINRRSLRQFFEFGYTFDDTQTVFENVFKVPPGHRLEIQKGRIISSVQFYSPPVKTTTHKSDSETEENLYHTLSDVIKEHLVADVPVGLLLSGGLDSSLIAAIASKHEKIHTFSMGFAESNIDERPYARLVSRHIGSEHQELLIQPSEIISGIESIAGHYDDLFADWGMISTRLLYKKCKERGIKVVLVGEGSDEIFAGYNVFKDGLRHKNRIALEWCLFQQYRDYAGRRYGWEYFNFRSMMKKYLSLCNDDLFSAVRMFQSRNQLPNNFVMKVDKASMSLGIEARTPFLDSRVADIAYQTPMHMLTDWQDEKKILKSIAQRYHLLPDEIINRRKFGAGIASNWMDESTEFREFARDIVLDNNSWTDELGFRDAMERYFNRSQKGYNIPKPISIFNTLAWRLLLLNLWSKSLGVSS